ncbi:hypothetical protein F3D3_1505 [Fusibacter sp. 3D3]|nr:hypothetical protein F3D3_1505 [Fusibacter sp. 3D3]
MVVAENAKRLANQRVKLLVQLEIKNVKINNSFSLESSLKLLFFMPLGEL